MAAGDGQDDSRPATSRASRIAVLVTALVLCLVVSALQVSTPPSSHIASVLVGVPAVIAFAFGPPMILGSAVVAAGVRWALLPAEPERSAPPSAPLW
ncbi:hypothetical protein [Streptomyces sp. NPDC013181]|uniref:hypothetical protein n=1 Tax=Streptomyces sp. NPDC013181 TaxID=3364864 RepID=UPI0036ACC27D